MLWECYIVYTLLAIWFFKLFKHYFLVFSAQKQFEFPSEKAASLAVRALSPELENASGWRAKASINTNKNLVLLKVVAKDKQAMDASVDSFSRLLGMCREISSGQK